MKFVSLIFLFIFIDFEYDIGRCIYCCIKAAPVISPSVSYDYSRNTFGVKLTPLFLLKDTDEELKKIVAQGESYFIENCISSHTDSSSLNFLWRALGPLDHQKCVKFSQLLPLYDPPSCLPKSMSSPSRLFPKKACSRERPFRFR